MNLYFSVVKGGFFESSFVDGEIVIVDFVVMSLELWRGSDFIDEGSFVVDVSSVDFEFMNLFGYW